MNLLFTYIVCLIVGQTITIGIGLAIDWYYSPTISLPASLVLYFLMFAVAWKVAVRITEPKAERIRPALGLRRCLRMPSLQRPLSERRWSAALAELAKAVPLCACSTPYLNNASM
jgi:hypothetical protein